MKKMTFTFILLLTMFSSAIILSAQPSNNFKTVHGKKANYTLSIPSNFNAVQAVGRNIDLNFRDDKGSTINTIVMDAPGTTERSIREFEQVTNREYIHDLQSTGLENVQIINRGLTTIDGTETYFAYYTSTTVTSAYTLKMYYHTISQFRNGKFIHVLYACEYDQRGLHMPFINRVIRSLKVR